MIDRRAPAVVPRRPGGGRTGLALATLLVAVAVAAAGCGGRDADAEPTPLTQTPAAATETAEVTAAPTSTPTPTPTPTVLTSRERDLLRPVSKQHALPEDFEPDDLVAVSAEWNVPGFGPARMRREAAHALDRMLAAAREDGLEIRVRSSYRSFATQADTFLFWVNLLGEERARRESAEPGHSEHQLGTTADLSSANVGWELVPQFGDVPEGQWLARHAHRYGFALSYPRNGEPITGYVYEPWHYRYIGTTHAAAWRASRLTLIEYLLEVHKEAGIEVVADVPATTADPAENGAATGYDN